MSAATFTLGTVNLNTQSDPGVNLVAPVDFGGKAISDIVNQGQYRLEDMDGILAAGRVQRVIQFALNISGSSSTDIASKLSAINSQISSANRYSPVTLTFQPSGSSVATYFKVIGGSVNDQGFYDQMMDVTHKAWNVAVTLQALPFAYGATQTIGSSGSPIATLASTPGTFTLTPSGPTGDVLADVSIYFAPTISTVETVACGCVSGNTSWLFTSPFIAPVDATGESNIGSGTSTTTGTTSTITTTSPAAAGTHVIVYAAAASGAVVTSIADNSASPLTWQVDKTATDGSSNTRGVSICSAYSPNVFPIGTTITITYSTSSSRKAAVARNIVGLSPTNWLIGGGNAHNDAGSTSLTAGSATTTTSTIPAFLTAAWCVTPTASGTTGSNWTAGSGYTQLDTLDVGASSPFESLWTVEYAAPISAANTFSPAASTTLSNPPWCGCCVAYAGSGWVQQAGPTYNEETGIGQGVTLASQNTITETLTKTYSYTQIPPGVLFRMLLLVKDDGYNSTDRAQNQFRLLNGDWCASPPGATNGSSVGYEQGVDLGTFVFPQGPTSQTTPFTGSVNLAMYGQTTQASPTRMTYFQLLFLPDLTSVIVNNLSVAAGSHAHIENDLCFDDSGDNLGIATGAHIRCRGATQYGIYASSLPFSNTTGSITYEPVNVWATYTPRYFQLASG